MRKKKMIMEMTTSTAGKPKKPAAGPEPASEPPSSNTLDTGRLSAIERQQAAEQHGTENTTAPSFSSVEQHPLIRSRYRLTIYILTGLALALMVGLALFYRQLSLPSQLVPYLMFNQEPVPVTATTDDTSSIQQQLIQARELSARLTDQPHLLGPLVAMYRNILDKQPQHRETLAALEQLQQRSVVLVAIYVEKRQYPMALQIADESLSYFPELADNVLLRALLKEVRKNAIVTPQPLNHIDTESAPAAPQTESIPSAPAAPILPSDQAERAAQTDPQQETIERLLQQAEQLRQQGALFAGDNSAAARYQSILTLRPDEPFATAGLTQLIATQIASIEQSIAVGNLDIAQAAITEPLLRFPEHPKLQQLSAQLASLRQPSISAIEVSTLPANSEQDASADTDNRTLLVSFNYRNFTLETTILTIQLRSLLQSTPIAEMPIIVQGKQGTKNVPVRITALVDKMTEGTYQLDFILEGNTVAQHEFSSVFNEVL